MVDGQQERSRFFIPLGLNHCLCLGKLLLGVLCGERHCHIPFTTSQPLSPIILRHLSVVLNGSSCQHGKRAPGREAGGAFLIPGTYGVSVDNGAKSSVGTRPERLGLALRTNASRSFCGVIWAKNQNRTKVTTTAAMVPSSRFKLTLLLSLANLCSLSEENGSKGLPKNSGSSKMDNPS